MQARPVTTGPPTVPGDDTEKDAPLWEQKDQRPWYLSLHRSVDNLTRLQRDIEEKHLPAMEREADKLHERGVTDLDDVSLAAEIRSRKSIFEKWKTVYWNEFIPFAHAIRVFGRVYNETVVPEDPSEFMNLLTGTMLEGVTRNRMLEDMAAMVRSDPALADRLSRRLPPESATFEEVFDAFVARFGDLSCSIAWCTEGQHGIVSVILELAAHPPRTRDIKPVSNLESRFFNAFDARRVAFARRVLDLARAGYRLRDDDNIVLGKIEGGFLVAMEEGKKRLGIDRSQKVDAEDLARGLEDPEYIVETHNVTSPDDSSAARKDLFKGQPAGPGIARGAARVVRHPEDLFAFKADEILVCRAVDPNMTFVAPLASGVVEERGGMLIHGAIIAREYGLPCVTGVSGILSRVSNGDMLVVDGFRGEVRCGTCELAT